ncbi:uncharacterized protein Bfra_005242 [Botrytis fragariae]|uniref:Uncharacterized protein n=1 Tax=Botrytis fragariae TaxID=1964551 RepID=A0A8H6AU59_9HELO|nr:uncharacterized protein Bfra_005242 [Botrytis fragariae]KAF5873776.1 hypothetical protein Bfra_005242 [Botrytis fragariae]
MIYRKAFPTFKSFPLPWFDENSTLKLELTPSIFSNRNKSNQNPTIKPYLADCYIRAVTREQHLFFEENGYLIITDALNKQEIKNHKIWAEVVPEPKALWPGQFSDTK